MYADYEYYKDLYLLGREPVIPEGEFPFWEKQAGLELDRQTFGRIRGKDNLITEAVKDCACALAELCYRVKQMQDEMAGSGLAGVITSYNNDGESATLDISQSIYTESGRKNEIRRLVQFYLGDTSLLYRGVIQCES